MKLLAAGCASRRRTDAYSLTQDDITRFGDKLTGVRAENDDIAIGAIQALEEHNLLSKVVVAGTDGIKDGMRNMQSGAQLETDLQDAMLGLSLAFQIAMDTVQGRPAPITPCWSCRKITKANVQHYHDQMFVNLDALKADLPVLVKKNLAAGTYGER